VYIAVKFTTGHDVTVKVADKGKMGMLKKWSAKWQCYINVSRLSEISDGDQLTVVVTKSTNPQHQLQQVCLAVCNQYII